MAQTIIPADIAARVRAVVADHTGRPAADIELRQAFSVDELGVDSLDIVDIIMRAEKAFGIVISDDEAMTLYTVADLARLVAAKLGRGGGTRRVFDGAA